jgi:hypothetical protein
MLKGYVRNNANSTALAIRRLSTVGPEPVFINLVALSGFEQLSRIHFPAILPEK